MDQWVWSRAGYIQMVRTIQENGAQNLWWFDIQMKLNRRHEGCLLEKLGWQDVLWQPELRGEWKVELLGSLVANTAG